MELARWAEKRGRRVNLRPKHWPFDPGLADRAAIAAVQLGFDPADYIGRACSGVWEEDRDLASTEEVAERLAAAGLDAEAVLARAESEDVRAAYRDTVGAAISAGVFGSPTYVLDGETFWGQDRIDLLDDALASGRPPYRPIE